MGVLTWIIVSVVVLAIIGLGVQVFFSGVSRGVNKVLSNPAVDKASDGAKEFASKLTGAVTSGIEKQFQPK